MSEKLTKPRLTKSKDYIDYTIELIKINKDWYLDENLGIYKAISHMQSSYDIQITEPLINKANEEILKTMILLSAIHKERIRFYKGMSERVNFRGIKEMPEYFRTILEAFEISPDQWDEWHKEDK